MSVEQMVRDLLTQAVLDRLVVPRLDSDRPLASIDPQSRTAGDLCGVANLLQRFLREAVDAEKGPVSETRHAVKFVRIEDADWKTYEPGTAFRVVVFLHPEEQGGFYWVEVPALPGCVSDGRNLEEALKNIRDALVGVISCYKEAGRPIPWRPWEEDVLPPRSHRATVFVLLE